MNLQSADFIVQEAATNLKRDRGITFATIGVVAVAIFVIGGVLLFFFNLSLWTNKLTGELKATVYLKSSIPRTRAQGLQTEIAAWDGVASARLITKEEGWEKFKQSYPGSERLGEFPIPWTDAIEVRTANLDDLPAIATKLADLTETKDLVPSLEQLTAEGGTQQKASHLRRGVHIVGYLLVIIMVLAGFLIVHNTIRLSLLARKREITIMQHVGATPGFVAAPFMVEGAIHGFIGALLACALLVPAHMYLRVLAANSDWALFQLLPDNRLLTIAVTLLFVGSLLGLTGALLSLRRFFSASS